MKLGQAIMNQGSYLLALPSPGNTPIPIVQPMEDCKYWVAHLRQFYHLYPSGPPSKSIKVASPKPHLLFYSSCLISNRLPFPSLFASVMFIKFHS